MLKAITNYEMLDIENQLVLRGNYSDFELLETVAVPYKIGIENVIDDQKINIEYRKINVNKKNIVIDFKVPDDATIIKW